jgi:hypothetical protein
MPAINTINYGDAFPHKPNPIDKWIGIQTNP